MPSVRDALGVSPVLRPLKGQDGPYPSTQTLEKCVKIMGKLVKQPGTCHSTNRPEIQVQSFGWDAALSGLCLALKGPVQTLLLVFLSLWGAVHMG